MPRNRNQSFSAVGKKNVAFILEICWNEEKSPYLCMKTKKNNNINRSVALYVRVYVSVDNRSFSFFSVHKHHFFSLSADYNNNKHRKMGKSTDNKLARQSTHTCFLLFFVIRMVNSSISFRLIFFLTPALTWKKKEKILKLISGTMYPSRK